MEEWIASDMILTEPIAVPTINFMRTSPVLERTDKRAVFSFSLSSDALSIGGVLIDAGKFLATNSHQGIVQKSMFDQKMMRVMIGNHEGKGHNKIKRDIPSPVFFNEKCHAVVTAAPDNKKCAIISSSS
jgi:hypothetical protein